jgi:hypothetical protein
LRILEYGGKPPQVGGFLFLENTSTRYVQAVEIVQKKIGVCKQSENDFSKFQLGKGGGVGGTPPPPPLLKAALGAGFTKMVCKILSPKELEVKILIAKGLAAFSRVSRVPPPP